MSKGAGDHRNELGAGSRIGAFAHFHINVEELNDLVETHGIGCEWRQAVWCPCIRPDTRSARAGCPHCRGLRFTYPQELRVDMIALVQNRHPQRSLTPSGELITGMAVITFPIGPVPAVGDMVLPCGEFHVVHETLWRAYNPIDNTAVKARVSRTRDALPPKIEAQPEKLLYPDPIEIDRLHWIDANGKLCVASAADYELVGNEIRWRAGRGPATGDGYSLRYKAKAAYILNPGEPVYRREGPGAGWPYKVEAARLDRWGDPSLQGEPTT